MECNRNENKCSRCNQNPCHVESNYILQPPKCPLLFVNRLRYTNNNVTKDRCSIPMDTTVMLGPHEFSLRATIDHHGPSIHSGHYTASINCCKKNKQKSILLQWQQNYGVWNYWLKKKPLLHMLYSMNWLAYEFWLQQDGGSLITPMALAHPLLLLTAGRGISAETCGLNDVFPPDDPCSRPETLCWYIYLYLCILYTSSVIWRIYTYTRSVVQYWWSCTLSQCIGLFFGSALFLCWMQLFVFLVYFVLLYDK